MGTDATTDEVRAEIEAAIRRIDQALAAAGDAGHEEVAAGVRQVIRVRDRMLHAVGRGELPADSLDRINAIVSLAFGTAFPLIGVHLHRFEQTRNALRSLAGSI